MKKLICLLAVGCLLTAVPVFAAPGGPGGRGPHGGMGRPPGGGMVRPIGGHRPMGPGSMHRHPGIHSVPPSHVGHVRPLPPPPPPVRPYRPLIRPYPYYYSSVYYPRYYYPATYYTYYPYTNYVTLDSGVTPLASEVGAIVVRDTYAGINAATNIINTAANVASTIKYLSW